MNEIDAMRRVDRKMNKHLAIVEDDPGVRAVLEKCLTGDGYQVTALPSGAGIKHVLSKNDIALVIVDIGLPDIDGLTLTRRIREEHDVGIIILSGRRELTDRVVGLEIGADDYITKPFEPREVLARVRSVLRRGERSRMDGTNAEKHCRYGFDEFTIDLMSQTVQDRDQIHIPLTGGEFKLLEAFVTHANRVLTREQLMDLVYVQDSAAFDRSIDVRIGRLRRKLRDNAEIPRIIKTVRNSGYIFVAKVTRL
jgi:two-component system OmpR family response regulator